MSSDRLRTEIRQLGRMLGETIQELDGPERFVLEEEVRTLAKARRRGESGAEERLIERLGQISYDECWSVARAFSIFFDLANLAEDRHRVRVLRERQREQAFRPESLGAAVDHLHSVGLTAEQVQELLKGLRLEPVFTAHPTEAKRRAVRSSLRRMRGILAEIDQSPDTHEGTLADQLREELEVMWQTDLLRPRKPTVIEEVSRGLFFIGTLWKVIPVLHRELRQAPHLRGSSLRALRLLDGRRSRRKSQCHRQHHCRDPAQAAPVGSATPHQTVFTSVQPADPVGGAGGRRPPAQDQAAGSRLAVAPARAHSQAALRR
jgi:phosphoenolpyruvate carboxylase